MSRINWHKTALIVLTVMATVVFAPISSAALVPYSQDFEAMTPGGGFPPDSDLSKDGWVVYADVWFGSVGTGVFVYSYGPFGGAR